MPSRFAAELEARLEAAVNAAAAHAGAAEAAALVARLELLLSESLNSAMQAGALDPAAFIADRVGRSAGEDAALQEFVRALRVEPLGSGPSQPSPGDVPEQASSRLSMSSQPPISVLGFRLRCSQALSQHRSQCQGFIIYYCQGARTWRNKTKSH